MNIPLWVAGPFVLLLLCIALLPLINHKWWGRYYPAVAIPLGLVTAILFLKFFDGGGRLLHTAMEYFAFISLLGSLFIVTGGILIRIEGRAHPLINAVILIAGGLVSNILGTTGASMLLIRPYLHLNRERLNGYLVVFFIFVVSNVGGALTPIGDPPLFLGYLKGVPFFWLLPNAWQAWAFAMFLIVAVFTVIDYRAHNRTKTGSAEAAFAKTKLVLKGWYNFLFLALIIISVFMPTPWREVIMWSAAALSWFLTPRSIHREHHFSFAPIIEVAILFFGIFATMVPALVWLEGNAKGFSLATPGSYYWATGFLSSFLDNAPTYLSFLSAAMGLTGLDVPGLLSHAPRFIIAISLGAVFFGACTYIGNGPNFMVKSTADHRGVNCPTFLGYIFKYSIPVLLPIFFLVWLIFIR